MNIVKADESLFMFLGETSNLIFTHAIYPADVVKFETAIKEVDEGEQDVYKRQLMFRSLAYLVPTSLKCLSVLVHQE